MPNRLMTLQECLEVCDTVIVDPDGTPALSENAQIYIEQLLAEGAKESTIMNLIRYLRE